MMKARLVMAGTCRVPRIALALRASLRALLVAAIGLAAGCATYSPAPIDPRDTASALEARTLDTPKLHEFIDTVDPREAATAPWDLSRLTLAALYYHPDLEVSRARLAASEAGVITAAESPNPSLGITPTKHTTILEPSAWTVGLMVDLVVETFGKRSHRIAEASALADAARHDLATVAWEVRGRVRSALLALWAAQNRVALIEHRRILQEQLVTLLEHRFSAGVASALDLARERIALNEEDLAARNTERQSVEARAALADAIGVPVRALDGTSLSFAAFEQPATALPAIESGALRREALTGRSDVQALLAEYAAAEAALQLEISRQFPNIILGPGYTYDQGDNQYTLGIAAELPILNQNQGPIAEAEARRRQAAARFTARQARIIGEIDRAVAVYAAATKTVSTADALRDGADSRRQRVEHSFSAGGVDRPTLITAELELAAIELSRFDAVVQQRQAIERLEDALERPIFDPNAALFMPRDGAHGLAEHSS